MDDLDFRNSAVGSGMTSQHSVGPAGTFPSAQSANHAYAGSAAATSPVEVLYSGPDRTGDPAANCMFCRYRRLGMASDGETMPTTLLELP